MPTMPNYRRSSLTDPRAMLAQKLMAAGTSTDPVQHPLQGVGRLGQALAGALMQKSMMDKEAAREAKYGQDMASIMRGGMAQPWVNPDTGETSKAPAGGLPGMMAAAGGIQNQDLAPFMSQLGMADVQQRQRAGELAQTQAFQRETRADDQQFRRDLLGQQQGFNRETLGLQQAQAEKMARLQAELGREKVVPGRDIPFPPEVLQQQIAIANAKAQAASQKPLDPLQQARLDKLTREETIANAAQADTAASFERTLRTADELLSHPGRKAATGASFLSGYIPATDAYDFMSNLDTFKSQNFLPAVQQLRGLGALSEAEGKKLEAAVGALNPRMSEDAFEKSLRAIRDDLQRAYSRLPKPKAAPATPSAAPAAGQSGPKFLGFE